ncbi:MAG: preprotein translocase subunit SecG [Patescibacteria group bacterium]|nr:preprotein translocase subunit SecG [Patescibacteria group bacterium]MDD5715810.1 preprotein translocase subunit SecG [Patescibacteria group bacterium]
MLELTLNIVQIVLAGILMAAVLLQNRGAGLGGVFGGEGNVYRTKRGFDKILFVVTIIVSIAFFGTAMTNILIRQ